MVFKQAKEPGGAAVVYRDLDSDDSFPQSPNLTVCLRTSSAPVDGSLVSGNTNTSTTAMNSSSLPLPCAGAGTVTTLNSIRTSQHTAQSPTPQWPQLLRPLNTTNNNTAPKKPLPKWLIGVVGLVLTAVGAGGYGAYKICTSPNFECCNNNIWVQCCK